MMEAVWPNSALTSAAPLTEDTARENLVRIQQMAMLVEASAHQIPWVQIEPVQGTPLVVTTPIRRHHQKVPQLKRGTNFVQAPKHQSKHKQPVSPGSGKKDLSLQRKSDAR